MRNPIARLINCALVSVLALQDVSAGAFDGSQSHAAIQAPAAWMQCQAMAGVALEFNDHLSHRAFAGERNVEAKNAHQVGSMITRRTALASTLIAALAALPLGGQEKIQEAKETFLNEFTPEEKLIIEEEVTHFVQTFAPKREADIPRIVSKFYPHSSPAIDFADLIGLGSIYAGSWMAGAWAVGKWIGMALGKLAWRQNVTRREMIRNMLVTLSAPLLYFVYRAQLAKTAEERSMGGYFDPETRNIYISRHRLLGLKEFRHVIIHELVHLGGLYGMDLWDADCAYANALATLRLCELDGLDWLDEVLGPNKQKAWNDLSDKSLRGAFALGRYLYDLEPDADARNNLILEQTQSRFPEQRIDMNIRADSGSPWAYFFAVAVGADLYEVARRKGYPFAYEAFQARARLASPAEAEGNPFRWNNFLRPFGWARTGYGLGVNRFLRRDRWELQGMAFLVGLVTGVAVLFGDRRHRPRADLARPWALLAATAAFVYGMSPPWLAGPGSQFITSVFLALVAGTVIFWLVRKLPDLLPDAMANLFSRDTWFLQQTSPGAVYLHGFLLSLGRSIRLFGLTGSENVHPAGEQFATEFINARDPILLTDGSPSLEPLPAPHKLRLPTIEDAYRKRTPKRRGIVRRQRVAAFAIQTAAQTARDQFGGPAGVPDTSYLSIRGAAGERVAKVLGVTEEELSQTMAKFLGGKYSEKRYRRIRASIRQRAGYLLRKEFKKALKQLLPFGDVFVIGQFETLNLLIPTGQEATRVAEDFLKTLDNRAVEEVAFARQLWSSRLADPARRAPLTEMSSSEGPSWFRLALRYVGWGILLFLSEGVISGAAIFAPSAATLQAVNSSIFALVAGALSIGLVVAASRWLQRPLSKATSEAPSFPLPLFQQFLSAA